MRKIILIVVVTAMMLVTLPTYASSPELHKARGTAYIIHGTCADGSTTRDGICAAPKELMGKTIIVYLRHYKDDNKLGSLVGIYEVNDHCPEGNIDIWCEDMEAAQDMMNRFYEEESDGRIYYQVLDAKG